MRVPVGADRGPRILPLERVREGIANGHGVCTLRERNFPSRIGGGGQGVGAEMGPRVLLRRKWHCGTKNLPFPKAEPISSCPRGENEFFFC